MEDSGDGVGIGDDLEDTHAAATFSAAGDVEREDAGEELCPGDAPGSGRGFGRVAGEGEVQRDLVHGRTVAPRCAGRDRTSLGHGPMDRLLPVLGRAERAGIPDVDRDADAAAHRAAPYSPSPPIPALNRSSATGDAPTGPRARGVVPDLPARHARHRRVCEAHLTAARSSGTRSSRPCRSGSDPQRRLGRNLRTEYHRRHGWRIGDR